MLLGGLLLLGIHDPAASADAPADYPARPIKLIVPYPPGGGVDAVARIIFKKLSDVVGQQVIVENKPGASTIIGTDAVARSAPDGYTLGLVTDSHAINAAFGRKLPYHETRDFTPVAPLINVPFVLLAHPTAPFSNARELIEYARLNPGKVAFASLGPGSPHQLAMEWFKKSTGTDIQIVSYRGVAPALNDTLAGMVQIMFAGASVADGHVSAGRLKILGHTSPRSVPPGHGQPIAKDIPGFALTTWYAIVGPAKLPRDIVVKLNAGLLTALASPEVKSQLTTLGVDPAGGSPEQLRELIRLETAKWGRIIEATGAKAE
jgi:tripartite-type tricarboxylate transporter receptor subunit TctC